jgi:hypothetical protein
LKISLLVKGKLGFSTWSCPLDEALESWTLERFGRAWSGHVKVTVTVTVPLAYDRSIH